ncbi:N1R/p28-like protein [Choristoneura rosaceana entomopoxvirus 'L']|uniref:N1R/p28-like protein n=1 Tax=Choristoneura rosaceana entomopoxvirus 'L' TaxID=1293539 RepID=A0ABM9QKQ3_9POXV|nr:N1R/p28-like protein [Choristoneura rosaceana entomopoxvirus 'L']CCU56117.1 N1R/p28-like protein [Choristoneura rosaceana entomopoxvirus 'L']
MNSIKYNDINIKIQNDKYNMKNVFNALHYDNYEEYFNDNDDNRYYSLKLLKKRFNDNEKEKELIEYLENNVLMDIFTFIKYNDYNINLGSWFKDIWYPLFEEKDILITNDILSFIYYFPEGGLPPPEIYKGFKKNLIDSLNNYNIKYIEIDYKHEFIINNEKTINEIKIIKSNNLSRKRWIILSVENFKLMIMRLNTKSAHHIREYYLLLETILYKYIKYVNNFNNIIKNNELMKLKEENSNLQRFNMNMKNFIDNVKEKNKNGYIYIATSTRYAQINNFKLGHTNDLYSRQSNFNSSHIEQDMFYICFFDKVFDMHKTEKLLHEILDDFRDKKNKEMFVIHYTYLLDIVKLTIKNINEPFDYINNLIKNRLSEMYNLKPYIPEKININNDEIRLNELKQKIINILDEYIKNNNIKISRIDLLNKLDIENISRNKLWNFTKQIIGWVDSKTPIDINNIKILITYI